MYNFYIKNRTVFMLLFTTLLIFIATLFTNNLASSVEKVDISGVLFTRTLGTNLPYYVCNYDDRTGLTDTITSGTNFNAKTFKQKISNEMFAEFIARSRNTRAMTRQPRARLQRNVCASTFRPLRTECLSLLNVFSNVLL